MVEYVPKEEVPSNPTERQQQRQQQQQHQQHQQHQQLQPHQHQPQHGQQHPHQPHQPYHPQSTGPSEQSGGTSQSPTEYQQPRNIQFVRQFLYQMNPNYSATLKFVKDLDVMTRDWTTSEVRFNRRLVKFNFTTENHIQVINFEPITPSEYDNMKPTISCIYWREMGTHVVTSVDIILLLEYFVNQTFDVEEKNRIRRNLQSLKPNTISRANLKDRNFFNLIMSMENPRPRNIEKDLKVFNWSDLGKAISKVMSKYYVVPGDRAHNTNVMNNSNQQWGSIPLTQQQVVRSPQVLPSPIIGSTPPSTTSFQYTPIQQQFPGIPSPGYYSRHPSLPNVTSSQLSTSPNTGGFPTQDPYMHFDKLHTYDQLAQPPPPPPPLQQHQQHQPPIEFTQQQCSSIYQPVVSYANHFNSSPALRTPSMPHVFPTNFQQPQQPQQPQQKYLQQPISVQSEPERISPAISHMNPPSNKNRFQPATGFVSGPIGSSDHSRSSSLIQNVLNAPFNPATSFSGSSSEPLKLASNSDTSASDINDPPSIASWNDNTRQTTPGIRVANKRLNLQDLITREENEHKIESNDDYNDKERDGDKDKGVDNISRLPSIAHLLNNDDMHLPSIKKHKNSNT